MRSVAVFTGANSGADEVFTSAAEALGAELARRQCALVYGGGRVGLMGAIADAVLNHGGKVIGVIPGFLSREEVAHPGLSEMHVVGGMHERKAKFEALCDGFIAMPGGFGTLDELFEALTWAQLGLHTKPLGLLNVTGYFDKLMAFVDQQVACGFVRPAHRDMLLIDTDPASLLNNMATAEPVKLPKWLDRQGD